MAEKVSSLLALGARVRWFVEVSMPEDQRAGCASIANVGATIAEFMRRHTKSGAVADDSLAGASAG